MKQVNFNLDLFIHPIVDELIETGNTFSPKHVMTEMTKTLPKHNFDFYDVLSSVVKKMENVTTHKTKLIEGDSYVSYEWIVSNFTNTKGFAKQTDSSFIKSIMYSNHAKILVIIMEDNAYVYEDFPEQLYINFEDSLSYGKFYNQYIKGKYNQNHTIYF